MKNEFGRMWGTAFLCAWAIVCGLGGSQSHAQSLTAEQAALDVRVAKRALTEMHPALNKYATQSEIDTAIARFEERGNQARSAVEMYLAATELAAAIRCGHTWTNTFNQRGPVKSALLESADKLPIEIVLVEARWLVTASAAAAVSVGDELLAINGLAAGEIFGRMRPYLRADGASDGKRMIQLNHDRSATSMMDLVWPLLSPPRDGRYDLLVRRASGDTVTAEVEAVSLSTRNDRLTAQGRRAKSDQWTLVIDGDVATMSLPTFAFWNTRFDWKAWLESSFETVRQRSVRHLVIDVRANEGGDGAISRELLSYLLKSEFTPPSTQAFSAYERVPYILAKYVDTWDYGFFDRTGNVEKLGEKRFLFKPKSGIATPIFPKSHGFRGTSYLLVGAENSSATFQLAQMAKLSRAAVLVGQRTGGNLRGLNGGELAWVTLPGSGVSIDIPLLANNPETPQSDVSVEPDVLVAPTFSARSAGRDLEIETTRRLIEASRARLQ